MTSPDRTQKRLRALIEGERKRARAENELAYKHRLSANDELWSLLAHIALDPPEEDTALGRAFSACGLEPADPLDWRRIASLLAEALFPEKGPPGRPHSWSWVRYCELLDAVDQRKQRNAKVSDRRACELIVQDPESTLYLRKAGVEGLLKALKNARSPKQNPAWAAIHCLPNGNLSKKEWDKIEEMLARDPKAAEALLLRKWREWRAKGDSSR